MKIKIIDLLNMISRGEEVPKKIKYNACLFAFERQSQDYYCEEYGNLFEYLINEHRTGEFLNDEVKIIEEDNKDKEIEVYINSEKVDITDIYEPLKQGEYFYKENGKWYMHKLENISVLLEEDKTIEKIPYMFNLGYINMDDKGIVRKELNETINGIYDKINEIIDVINKGD